MKTIALTIICALATLMVCGIFLYVNQKRKEKRHLKRIEKNNQLIKANEEKLRKKGLKPFKVGKSTIWAISYKAAINEYNSNK